ncbi:MAG: SDR family NAD(P)-dependent oxidoreductase [Nitrospinota bacterium]|jgi:NAD(P)-dependent dehydrogenase (short-subunit alcohol dehydrogenase family)|nr:SDR family NAD(P)-dependent oxidoreductase [Nitrospinota bacterium]
MMKTVLVTGTSSGIGKATAELLSEKGYFVYANVLEEDHLAIWESAENIQGIVFDVRKKEEIARARDVVQSERGELYGIVNNAGISNWGPILDISDQIWKDNLETNLMGAVTVTRTFFPLLSKDSARIVNVSSVTGKLVLPFMGPYHVAKAALEAFSDTLRREFQLAKMRHIKVSVIEPASVDTAIWTHAEQKVVFPESSPFYSTAYKMGKGLIQQEKGVAIAPRVVARTIFKALSARRPRIRYMVGPQSTLIRILCSLPDWVVDRVAYAAGKKLLK